MNMQIPDAMEGLVTELVEQCSGTNGATRFEAFKLWLKSVLLRRITEVVLGSVERFSAVEKFSKSNPLVKFWDFGLNFKTNFGNRIETNVAGTTIVVDRLEQKAKDPAIKSELGGTNRVFTISLAHFYQMIEAQGQGQAGPLLTNGYANIAYIEGMDNCAVSARWYAGDGWDVYASSVGSPLPWRDESLVLSRKSV